MNSTSDVIIIGGGIIGFSIACQLSQQGIHVTLIERGQPGQEASSAAAGMLAPQAEVAHGAQGPLLDLCVASHAIYPDFVRQLEEATQIRIGYRQTGTLFVASDFDEATLLAGIMEQQETAGLPSQELSPEELRKLEPALAESLTVGLFLPKDHHVDNRVLMKALVAAALKQGVRLMTGTPALGLVWHGDRVAGVKTSAGEIQGEIVINAAGSWAGQIDARLAIPVKPARGQIVKLRTLIPVLHHLIHSAKCYMAPWPDGRLRIGSTLEDEGYNKQVTAGGVHKLLNGALAIVPSLAEAAMEETWAGFRPEAADDMPILGWSGIRGLMMATAHFRNGILLAPITARIVADLILGGSSSISLEPFSLHRFRKCG